ncbi:MAG: endolytic transglycosylase MltG [Spirochaetales bacterium]|jgi:UPF0755 protein|nr:endolytic transglycosylase MltG [Spirochaetales bacterium]
MKKLLRLILVAVILVGVIVIAAAVLTINLNKVPSAGDHADTVFAVKRGESVHQISSRLEEAGLIRSNLFLRIYSRLKGTETAFQSGSYRISGGATTLEIHDVLVLGSEILHKVTIPEGWTLSRISEVLEDAEITSAEEFRTAAAKRDLLAELGIRGSSADGFLFPDTYMFPKNYPAEEVLRHMVARFYAVLDDMKAGYRNLSEQELYAKIILASIIEREYVVPEEAPFMASVFYNRLDIDMKLQSCATVVYALSEELDMEYPEYLTLKDLEVESDYNTYLNPGIPPGPISNPGRTALTSVFFPERTDYLFFLLKDPNTGTHEFTATYGQHLSAKNLYIKKS